MNVLVIGAGRMGSQIGVEYALGGHEVVFVARRPAAAHEAVERAFALVATAGLAGEERIAAAKPLVTVESSLDAVEGEIELIVESIVESMETKVAALAPLVARWPGAIVATNTSSLSVTAIGAAIGAVERTIGAHYWNPPLLMPMVEVIVGERTEPGVNAFVLSTLRALGKRPVEVNRDVPGFAWNRLQFALLREAVWLVENGVASAETVDEIVREGLARRWRLTGPFATAALGGADSFTRIAANLFPELSDAERLDGLAGWLPPAEGWDEIRARRDRGLIRELASEASDDGKGG